MANQIFDVRRKIVVSSRRTLPNYWIDPRVEFVAVDFLDPKEQVAAKLEHICKDVTHAFYTSYIHEDDFKLLKDKNVPLFRNFIDVIDAVCPNLQRVCLQTGGKVCGIFDSQALWLIVADLSTSKHYGAHLGPVQVPLTEDIPRYDDGGYNFYYSQEDYMFEVQKRRGTWSHNIIRPNGIVGFTPHCMHHGTSGRYELSSANTCGDSERHVGSLDHCSVLPHLPRDRRTRNVSWQQILL